MTVKRRIVIILLVVCMAMLGSVPTGADEPAPYLNNTATMDMVFTITDSGKACVSYDLLAYQEYFLSATIVTYIEKRVLGLFWTRVDIGMPDNQWSDFTSLWHYTKGHTVQLSSKGTYRATVTFIVRGTGGPNDEVTLQDTAVYD